MYGALLGDMIGAPYEFDRGSKTKEFPLFGRGTEFTDDSVMTVAVTEALLDALPDAADEWTERRLVNSMRAWGGKYPNAGYGGRFYLWLRLKDPQPYGSYGNGSAMRVSTAGWMYDTLEMQRSRIITRRGSRGQLLRQAVFSWRGPARGRMRSGLMQLKKVMICPAPAMRSDRVITI